MLQEYYRIKDLCRSGLLSYLMQELVLIPKDKEYRMLDIGCGTGVPSMLMAGTFKGSLTAIDTENTAAEFFINKVKMAGLQNRISIDNVSFFDFTAGKRSFDIILVEGFLNIVGFENGLEKIVELIKPGGYIIIHDEFKDHDKKVNYIEQQGCKLIHATYLDETIWWNEYYKNLKISIKAVDNFELKNYFANDIKELEYFKINKRAFRSIYYLLSKD